MVYLHDGILHTRKKEGAPILHDSMDRPRQHYAKWNSQVAKVKCHMSSLISGTKSTKQTKEQNRIRNLEISIRRRREGMRGKYWEEET